ncbi:MAG TPA: hypothetical protein VFN96_05205 [Gemmatimonadales bacterium]|nr:hypothetical protein [Gemmatimonadales bacterium]
MDKVGGPPLRFGDRAQNEVRQQLRVPPLERERIDVQLADGPAAIHADPDQAGAGRDVDHAIGELGLKLLQAALNLLAELK